jgi:hypothetical protein
VSSITTPDRYTTLPDERVLASTVTALPGRIHVVLVREAVGF